MDENACLNSLILGIVSTVIGGIILVIIGYLFRRPRLYSLSQIITTPEKFVGSWTGDNRRGTTDFKDSIERTAEGNDYFFYLLGITNKQKCFINETAIIYKTTMRIWDDNTKDFSFETGCRWWSPEFSSSNPLFTKGTSDFGKKNRTIIPVNSTEYIVLGYSPKNQKVIYRFSTDSDENIGFPAINDRIANIPCHLLISIYGEKIERFDICIKIDKNKYVDGFAFEILSDSKKKKKPFRL